MNDTLNNGDALESIDYIGQREVPGHTGPHTNEVIDATVDKRR